MKRQRTVLVRCEVKIRKEILERIDVVSKERGWTSRSEAIRHMIDFWLNNRGNP